jgi:hypothetical protein
MSVRGVTDKSDWPDCRLPGQLQRGVYLGWRRTCRRNGRRGTYPARLYAQKVLRVLSAKVGW